MTFLFFTLITAQTWNINLRIFWFSPIKNCFPPLYLSQILSVDPIHSEDRTVYPGSHSGTSGDEVLPRNAAMDESGDKKLFAHSSCENLLQQLKVGFSQIFCILYTFCCCFDGVFTCQAFFPNTFFYD